MFGKKSLLSVIFVVLLSFGLIGGCGGSSSNNNGGGGGGGGGTNDALIQAIINQYVDNVVIATYGVLADRSSDLKEAVEDLRDDPTDENLEAARDAWVVARRPWEQTEAWLFGPVDAKGHDPALDSWPVNRTDLQALLDSDVDFTPEFIRTADPLLKGFHGAEFILFDFEIEDLGDREFEYLVAVACDIELTADELFTDWTQGDGGLFTEPFGQTMKTAGPGNNVFPSLVTALQQIIDGMSIIIDEVSAGKIADPFDTGDVESVESQFSFNSLLDFQNDIRGVQNAWLGDYPDEGLFGQGLNDLIFLEDPALTAQVTNEIAAAIAAIGNIPPPFRDAINDPDAADEIVAAQNALDTLFATLNGPVLDIINSQ
ncbi:MAG: imelysin family protein [Thermodesulfobacteriota bacterium]